MLAFSKFSFNILETWRFPDFWFNIKVVLIPKKQGSLTLKALRPLAIASVPYRLFGKALLELSQHGICGLHPHSVGGVPGRSAQGAFLIVAMLIEHVRMNKGSFAGLAVDTQIFFRLYPFCVFFALGFLPLSRTPGVV